MEVMKHFNGEVAGSRPSGLLPQPDDDAIATAVSNIITDVVKNGEIAKEESCLGRQIAEFCNGNAEEEEEEEEEEEKELDLERNKQRRRIYLDKDRPEATKAGDHDDEDIKTSAEIGNIAEIHSLVSTALRGETKDVPGGSREDEVIELEFFDSRAADKVRSTHDAYCPHCRNPISKVVLRIRRGTVVGPPLPAPEPAEKDLDLLGCLSCFKIFLPSREAADGEKSINERAGEQQQESESASHNGKCFGFLDWIYEGQRSTTANSKTSPKQPSDSESCSSGQGKKKPVEEHLRGNGDCLVQNASTPLLQGIQTSSPDLNGNASATKHEPHYLGKPSAETHLGLEERDSSSGREVHIPIDESTNEARALTATQVPTVESGRRGSYSIEVVKSVVYGGLMEAIASLTLVSSAAASGATTLRVFTIGVANLIGGLVIMAHNFMDLCKNHPASVYQEVLGQKKHFPLHAIVALLSYLIFGLASPVIYGFTFRERDDRDSKLLAVAVASSVCIVLLSIAKAYTQRGANTFREYSLTVLQYAVTAAMASGIACVVGDLFGKMTDELGWINSTPPNVVPPKWDSY